MSNSISLSDSYVVLLDDSLKETQILREQFRQRDEENAERFQDLTNKVDSLCKLISENNSRSVNKESKSKGQSKIHVPSRCRKVARRIAAIDQMTDWNDEKKEHGKKFLTIEYTSSDESEVSDDENGPERKRFLTKRLA